MTEQEKQEALAQIEADRKANPSNVDTGKFDWEDLATGGYSALNTALFGIPDVLVKAASSDAYKKLKDLRERNRAAATVGDVAGAFAPTGGALFKGVGTAAKLGAKGLEAAKLAKAAGALGKAGEAVTAAGDIVKGAKAVKGLPGAIGRGALAGAEQAIPRFVTGEGDLKELGTSVGLGGALGGAGHVVTAGLQRLPEAVTALGKWADKTILKRADITNKVMRTQAAYAGEDLPKYMRELADFAEARQLHREPEVDKLVAEVKGNWKKMGEAFDASDFKINVQDVVDNPDVAQAIKRDVGLMDKIDDIVTKTEATTGFTNKRSYLNEIIYDQSGKYSIEEKKIAKSLIDQIEGEAERLTGLDVGEAKQAWRMMKPFEQADILDDMRVSSGGLKGGSDTAAKLALGGLGFGVGASTSIKGLMDDPTNPEAWTKFLTASASGALVGAANKKVGILLAKMARKLPADKIERIIQDISEGKIAKVLSTVPKEELPVAATKFFTGRLRDGQPLETELTVEGAEGEKPAEEPGMEPQFSQEYVDKLNEKMVAYWAQNFADSMTYGEYVQAVKDATDNFNPRKTASFFFKDKKERANFLTSLDVAGKFKGVTDVGEIMKKPDIIQGVFEPGQAAEKRLKREEFIDSIAKLVTSEGSLPSKTTKDTIQADISAILALSATPEEKKELILNKLEEKYGLGYTTLKQLGLA